MKFLSYRSITLLFAIDLVQSETLTPTVTETTGLDGQLAIPTDDMFDDADDAFDTLLEDKMRGLKSDSGSSSSSSSSDDNGYRYRYNGNYNSYNGYNNGYNQYNSGSSGSSSTNSYNSGSSYNGSYNSATGGYNDYSSRNSYSTSSASTSIPWKTYTLVTGAFVLLVAGAIYGPVVKKRMIQTALELDEEEKQRKRSVRPSSSKNKPREPLFKRSSRRKEYYDDETTATSGLPDDYTEMGDNVGAVAPYYGPPPVYHPDQYYPPGPYDTGNGSQYFTDASGHYDGGEQYYGENYSVDNQYYPQDNGMPDYPGYR